MFWSILFVFFSDIQNILSFGRDSIPLIKNNGNPEYKQ